MNLNFLSCLSVCRLCVAAMLISFGAVKAVAQQTPPQAAYRFVNATSLPDKVLFTNDGRKLRPDGFGPGDNTSSIGTPAGPHRLSASTATAKPAEINLTLQPNTATTVIAYSKQVVDPVTKKSGFELQLFSQADPARDKGKQFYILYVSARPNVELAINGEARTLPALRAQKADDSRGSIKVEYGGKPVVEFTANESGAFVAVISDKPDGGLAGILLPDYN